MYQINIEKVTNGLIVKVGCSKFVFESTKGFLIELEAYLENPEKIEKEYRETYKINDQVAVACEDTRPVPPGSDSYPIRGLGELNNR